MMLTVMMPVLMLVFMNLTTTMRIITIVMLVSQMMLSLRPVTMKPNLKPAKMGLT